MKTYREYYWIGWAVLMFSFLSIMLIMDFKRACCSEFLGWYNFWNGMFIFAFGGLLGSSSK